MRPLRKSAAAASKRIAMQLDAAETDDFGAPENETCVLGDRENPVTVEPAAPPEAVMVVPKIASLLTMPLEVLEKIVAYLKKAPSLVARLALLNKNMYFLVGGMQFWRIIATEMHLTPSNPNARKYRTWLAVVGKKGPNLCHWCYKTFPKSDLLKFGFKADYVRLCGPCRAVKWRDEKNKMQRKQEAAAAAAAIAAVVAVAEGDVIASATSSTTSATGQEATATASTAARVKKAKAGPDPYNINKQTAKELYCLSEADMARFPHCTTYHESGRSYYERVWVEYLYRRSEILEYARTKWGGDGGIAARCRDRACRRGERIQRKMDREVEPAVEAEGEEVRPEDMEVVAV
ncbi:hypothetical protein HDU93_006012 [Gonapodya sp. JEL0774]|nr:hypothetical protein HDU93_006012 [Gonapodya sp. JEL0774]